MFVRLSTMERAIQRAAETEAGLRDELARANKGRKEWRGAFREQLGQRRKIEGERDAALKRAEAAEAAYYGLVNKMLTPPQAPAPVAPVDPDLAMLDRISDETVKRMSEQFVRDGLSADVAEQHAQEIVMLAERAWGGAPGSV